MTRANEQTAKVFYKGSSEDFVVFVDDIETLNKWRKDRSIPLADVVNGFKIFVTHKHGAQGIMDGASRKILENGEYQSSVTRERQGGTNDAKDSPVVGR
ncbi:RNA binding protein [Aspergillus arachidicola]|uniref:RNA binding protein n=1 Tax=Aspergillus arachidicola TaxID=656916 RepID=A0A2G7FKU1_9EURO|nr:RNA binding protein [Aspergillus arachidicola]